LLFSFSQAPDSYLRRYRPFQHEDGLLTAIMGLEFPFTPEALPGRRKIGQAVSSVSESRMSVSLRCSSSVSTVNAEMQTTETHHQKSAEHLSFGSFFSAAAAAAPAPAGHKPF